MALQTDDDMDIAFRQVDARYLSLPYTLFHRSANDGQCSGWQQPDVQTCKGQYSKVGRKLGCIGGV